MQRTDCLDTTTQSGAPRGAWRGTRSENADTGATPTWLRCAAVCTKTAKRQGIASPVTLPACNQRELQSRAELVVSTPLPSATHEATAPHALPHDIVHRKVAQSFDHLPARAHSDRNTCVASCRWPVHSSPAGPWLHRALLNDDKGLTCGTTQRPTQTATLGWQAKGRETSDTPLHSNVRQRHGPTRARCEAVRNTQQHVAYRCSPPDASVHRTLDTHLPGTETEIEAEAEAETAAHATHVTVP